MCKRSRHVKSRKWHLDLALSSQFSFLNRHEERDTVRSANFITSDYVGQPWIDGDQQTFTLNFTITPGEFRRAIANTQARARDVEVLVTPSDKTTRITYVETMFKEVSRYGLMRITFTVEGVEASDLVPWRLAFDFYSEHHPQTSGHPCGTHAMFSLDEPSEDRRNTDSPYSPESILKHEYQLHADTFCDLKTERLTKARYGELDLWRLTAIGYQASVYLVDETSEEETMESMSEDDVEFG
ncbi:hypothetical protein EK21DRAFT_92345 [Setomelanomma holmii]|uniref:Uncharacterized protein n=1 Tax=Setomelanomma holmii TaxID=210430 RepID=A0A9P4LIF8_9PLEO|nr:hypothetical protein EK21DRAFT_92345 [Setomelanomma holmii]